MDAWTFVWLFFILKIPIVALFLLIRWAVREPPESAPADDGGIGPRSRPLHPHHPRHPRHPRSRLPRSPRRGPHGEPLPAAPPRTRTVITRGRLAQH
jgi:hypothetical protein